MPGNSGFRPALELLNRRGAELQSIHAICIARAGVEPRRCCGANKVPCVDYLTAHADSFQSDPFDIFTGIRAERVTGIVYLPVTKRTLCRRPDRVSETTTCRNIIHRLLPGSRENARRLAGQAGARAASSGTRCRGGTMPPARLRRRAETSRRPSRSSRPARNSPHSETRSPWLSGYSFHATRHVLKYQADAWKAFFRGEADRPRFRSTYGTTPSFTIPDTVRISGVMITVPRTGPMRIRRRDGNPYPDGKPVKAVVKKIAGKWSCSEASC